MGLDHIAVPYGNMGAAPCVSSKRDENIAALGHVLRKSVLENRGQRNAVGQYHEREAGRIEVGRLLLGNGLQNKRRSGGSLERRAKVNCRARVACRVQDRKSTRLNSSH